MRLKRSDLIVVALLLLAYWNPQIPGLGGGIIRPSGPVDRVVVLYESSVGGLEGAKIAAVTGGTTSQALRKADKWRLWDKDSVPDGSKGLLADATSLPWVVVLHGPKATHSGPLPPTEADFAALIAKQGGI